MSAVHVRVRLFAALRERVGSGELALVCAGDDGDALAAALADACGPETGAWLLAAPNRIARNQTLVDLAALRFSDGDELALLPPVTGG